MTRLALAFALCAAVGLPVSLAEPLGIVLLLDVTSSVTEAMATVQVSDPMARPGWDGTGSRENAGKPEVTKKPNSPRDVFLTPILRTFVPNLGPEEQARIGSVSRVFRLSPEFTRDGKVLAQAVREAVDVPDGDRYGPTPLWDAVDAAVTALGTWPGRRALILVTDGLATGNRLSLDTAIARATQARVSVSVVCEWWGTPRTARVNGRVHVAAQTNWPWKVMAPFMTSPDVLVERLATSTGGIMVPDGVDALDPDLHSALARVLRHLHGG